MVTLRHTAWQIVFKCILLMNGLILFTIPLSGKFYVCSTPLAFTKSSGTNIHRLYDASKPGILIRNDSVFLSVDKRYYPSVILSLPVPVFHLPYTAVQITWTDGPLYRPITCYPIPTQYLRGPPAC